MATAPDIIIDHGTIPERRTIIRRLPDGRVGMELCAEQCRDLVHAMGADFSRGVFWLIDPRVLEALR